MTDYLKPGTLIDAIDAISKIDVIDADDTQSVGAVTLAGGTDLVVQWRHKSAPIPDLIVDLKGIDEMAGISVDSDRVRIGPCTVPREGPVILAANHTAGIDPLLILATCPQRMVGFVVERRYYHWPIANWFMRQVDCIPVNRDNPGKSFFAACIRHLRRGGCLGIFPPGTFESPDQMMGAKSGYLTLMAGIAGGAEMVCIPEIPFGLKDVASEVANAYVRGKKHCIITVAEGAEPHAREIAEYLSSHREETGFGVRLSILGHIQRGGSPMAYDRFLGTRFGATAVKQLHKGTSGVMVGLIDGQIVCSPLAEVTKGTRPLDESYYDLARVLAR